MVSLRDASANLICLNPELVSSLEKTVAPLSWASTWSTAGSTCLSLQTLSLSFVKSTQIRSLSLGFGTTTMPAHHSVGSLILVITPMLSILSNSFLTLGLSGSATHLGVWSTVWLELNGVFSLQ